MVSGQVAEGEGQTTIFSGLLPRLTALPPSGYDPAHLIRW